MKHAQYPHPFQITFAVRELGYKEVEKDEGDVFMKYEQNFHTNCLTRWNALALIVYCEC